MAYYLHLGRYQLTSSPPRKWFGKHHVKLGAELFLARLGEAAFVGLPGLHEDVAAVRALFVDGMEEAHVFDEHLAARLAREGAYGVPVSQIRIVSLHLQEALGALVPAPIRKLNGDSGVQHVTAHNLQLLWRRLQALAGTLSQLELGPAFYSVKN